MREPYTERWDRWIEYAAATGIYLERLVVHPDDAAKYHYATYRSLPIVVLGARRMA